MLRTSHFLALLLLLSFAITSQAQNSAPQSTDSVPMTNHDVQANIVRARSAETFIEFTVDTAADASGGDFFHVVVLDPAQP